MTTDTEVKTVPTDVVATVHGHFAKQGTPELWSEVDALRDALWRACYSAAKQLEGMGKGRDPSPRLQDALDRAIELLGFDPTTERPEFNDL